MTEVLIVPDDVEEKASADPTSREYHCAACSWPLKSGQRVAEIPQGYTYVHEDCEREWATLIKEVAENPRDLEGPRGVTND